VGKKYNLKKKVDLVSGRRVGLVGILTFSKVRPKEKKNESERLTQNTR